MPWTIHQGDALETLRGMDAASFDAVLCDPPYGLSFMGKAWDHGVPSSEVWMEVLRVLKPGAHLLAFGGTRTFHRLTCAIEDAGFEIRDCISWLYGSGFPKSMDISKALDKRGGESVSWFGPWLKKWRADRGITQKEVATLFPSKSGGLTGCVANWEMGFNMPTPEQFNLICSTFRLPFASLEEAEREVVGQGCKPKPTYHTEGIGGGAEANTYAITAPATDAARTWNGYGTALKPAWEPCIVAMKPLDGTFAENALRHGVAGLNIDAGRIAHSEDCRLMAPSQANIDNPSEKCRQAERREAVLELKPEGRWPANLILDAEAGAMLDAQSGMLKSGANPTRHGSPKFRNTFGEFEGQEECDAARGADSGGASRFFYCAKASRNERDAGLDHVFPKVQAHAGGFDGCSIPLNGSPISISRNHHPCLKPLDLNRYLASLILPPKRDTPRRILVPFSGSGSEMIGALLAGWDEAVGIEREADYCAIAEARLRFWTQPDAWEREMAERAAQNETFDDLPLFGGQP